MSYNSQTFSSGQTSIIYGLGNIKYPASIQLTSSSSTRAIQISLDNGLTFFTPPIDYSDSTKLVLSIVTPVSSIKVTGVSGDLLHIVDSD